jgi:cereblon
LLITCVLFYFKDKDVKVLDDPCLLSFQVLRLGIFQPKQVSFLLGIESTNLRLQYEISYWNDNVRNKILSLCINSQLF